MFRLRYSSFLLGLILASVSAWQTPVRAAKGREDIGQSDPIYEWIDHPHKRDPGLVLAFVEIVSVREEHVTITNASNAAVSYDGGKTWNSLMAVRTGFVTLKVIECPDAAMPQTLTDRFESGGYIPTRDTAWQDRRMQPRNRFLAFFRRANGDKWSLQHPGAFYDPVDYLLIPSYAKRLQAMFNTRLADEDAVKRRRKELDDAAERARQNAATANKSVEPTPSR